MPLGSPEIANLAARRDIVGLIKALTRGDWQSRCDAVDSLAELGDRRAVQPLIGLVSGLQEHDPHDREFVAQAAARALGRIGDARAVDPLIAWMDGGERRAWKRIVAAHALGSIGDNRAAETLAQALRDPDTDVRVEAALALGRMNDDRGIELIIESVPNRSDAAEVLANLDAGRAVDPLAAVIHNADADLESRAAAAVQLWRIDRRRSAGEVDTVADLVKALDARSKLDPTNRISIDPRHVDLEAAQTWLKGRSSPDALKAAEDAAHAVAETWREELIGALLADPRRLDGAGIALSRVDDPRAIDAIQTALRAILRARKPAFPAPPVALGEIAVQPLVEALEDPNFATRTVAAVALRDFDTPEARQALDAHRARRR